MPQMPYAPARAAAADWPSALHQRNDIHVPLPGESADLRRASALLTRGIRDLPSTSEAYERAQSDCKTTRCEFTARELSAARACTAASRQRPLTVLQMT